MTAIMRDAAEELGPEQQRQYEAGDFATILYVDDMLLIGLSTDSLQEYLDVVARIGERFTLASHWDKFQLLHIRCGGQMRTSAGGVIAPKASMTYLGTTLYADGKGGAALNRQLRMG